tara:strand:- start:2277 stop:2771 length:495 start_codon:yes stop_codon:yes gene_type:complete
MLSWRDIVLYGLGKKYPRDIVSQIVRYLQRESISQLVEESRNYHVNRMPKVERLFYADYDPSIISDDYYLNIEVVDPDYEEEANIYSQTVDELTDKWLTINPKGKEYTYFDIWRWDRFQHPNINFIYAFNRGRIFLRFLMGYEWYNLDDEANIVDKLTDYKELN